jgi:hypothetical protein
MAKKTKELTLPEQIKAAQGRVAASLDIFKSARAEVNAAQADLRTVISNAQVEVGKYNDIINNATVELEYNDKIESKLAAFTE